MASQDLNRACLLGRLGADPELRFTQNNKAVLKFRLATSDSYQTDSGEKKETTQWHQCVLWGKRAEALSKFLNKGSRVYVEGRIETRSYDDKDGVKKYSTEINVQDVKLLDGKRDGGGSGGGGYKREERNEAPSGGGETEGGSDDDIPF